MLCEGCDIRKLKKIVEMQQVGAQVAGRVPHLGRGGHLELLAEDWSPGIAERTSQRAPFRESGVRVARSTDHDDRENYR